MKSSSNLVTNLSTRSSRQDYRPLVDNVGNRASFETCFVTTETQLAPEGDMLVLGFDLRKSMMVHAVLVMQDHYGGQSNSHTTETEYVQNFSLFIGDSQDWRENTMCPGSPFMKYEAGSDGWYYDERTQFHTPGYVWAYGKEAWCNTSGQYVHFVADLKHLAKPYTMSICSVGVMGASYVRSEPLPEQVELMQDEILTVGVPYIYNEFTPEIKFNVATRQASTAALLEFVTIGVDAQGSAVIEINAQGVAAGSYSLHIESYDSDSSESDVAWKSETIKVIVTEKPLSLVLSFPPKQIFATEWTSWELDELAGLSSALRVEVELGSLTPFLVYDKSNYSLVFKGDASTSKFEGSVHNAKITLTSPDDESRETYNQVIIFKTAESNRASVDPDHNSKSGLSDVETSKEAVENVEIISTSEGPKTEVDQT